MNNPSSLSSMSRFAEHLTVAFLSPSMLTHLCYLPFATPRATKETVSVPRTAQPRSAQDSEAGRTRTYHTRLGRVPRLAGNHGGRGSISAITAQGLLSVTAGLPAGCRPKGPSPVPWLQPCTLRGSPILGKTCWQLFQRHNSMSERRKTKALPA